MPPGPPAPIGGSAATDLPQQPVKGGGRGIFKIVVGVLVIGAVGFTFLRGFIEDSRWKAGACLDYYPTAIFEYDVDANIVDCSDDSARSRIVGEPDADCESLGSVASVTREDKTYCLVRA